MNNYGTSLFILLMVLFSHYSTQEIIPADTTVTPIVNNGLETDIDLVKMNEYTNYELVSIEP